MKRWLLTGPLNHAGLPSCLAYRAGLKAWLRS
jgi:hypothetical protein